MHMTTVREKTDTMKIRITTSADGLAGIPAEEYGDKVIEMVVQAFPLAYVEIEVDERTDGPSRVSVSAIGGAELTTRDEMNTEERVLEIVRHEAFAACCDTKPIAYEDPEERASEQAESIARGMRGAS